MKDVAKRAFDIAASALVLLLMAPVLALTALMVRLTLGTPVLFRQQRPGLHGAPFTILKFRTMRDALDPDGNALSDGERLTALGRFLRSTSLDEFPAFWNVIRGDMSMVGPRPLLMEYLPRYSPTEARRHEVRPGITGLAQVNGRNAITWQEKFALDVEYVDTRSFWLDVKILLMTARIVLVRQGISQQGHATAEKFRGSAR